MLYMQSDNSVWIKRAAKLLTFSDIIMDVDLSPSFEKPKDVTEFDEVIIPKRIVKTLPSVDDISSWDDSAIIKRLLVRGD